jgi:uncharacterized protein with HEPN domain
MADAAPIDTLLDLLELIERIERQIGGSTRDAFLQDLDAQDATAYRLLAIGEAARDLDEDLKSRNPHIPWRQILGMRNILAHEYFTRESEIIWETIKIGLPELVAVCAPNSHVSAGNRLRPKKSVLVLCFTIPMTILREIGSTLTRRTLPLDGPSMGEGRVGVIAPQYNRQQTTVMRLLSAINKAVLFFISNSPRR